jgi:hypothetical protein
MSERASQARRRGIPIKSRSDLLGWFCGVHVPSREEVSQ